MRDSYNRFFKNFRIGIDELIDFGIEDTIFPDEEEIREEWVSLINNVTNNKRVFIRGYGRDAKGTILFQEFYKITLKNNNIKKDSTNNNEPTRLLHKITGYIKTGESANINNYQVSHIFGKTKNPLMFTAPWNIVWNPKIFDPFTGHESKGDYTEKYHENFIKTAKNKYYPYIKDYNNLVDKYFNSITIDSALKKVEQFATTQNIGENIINKFKKVVYDELSKIDISDINN